VRRKKTAKKGIGSNLYHIFILSIGVPTILLAVIIFALFSSYYSGVQDRDISNLLNNTNSSINSILNSMRDINESCYISSEAFDALPLFVNPSLEVDPLNVNKIRRNYEDIIYKNLFGRNLDAEAVSFFPYTDDENESSFVVSRASEGIFIDDNYEYKKENWYINIKEGKTKEEIVYSEELPAYLSPFYNKEFATVSIIQEINNINTNKPIGVMRTDVRLSRFKDIFDNMLIPRNSYLLIADSNKNIIVSSSTLDNYAQYYFDTDNSDIIHGYDMRVKDVTDTNLKIYYLNSKSDSIMVFVIAVLVLIGIILIENEIAFIIYKRESKEIVKSINSLNLAMMEYSRGNFDAKASRSSIPYMDNFAISLNTMAEDLKDTIEREYVAVINRQTAEYNALQSQINPHFFYNTLNGFIALNRMGETKKLEKSIISLTKLFRYTCGKTDLVSVSDEFAFVKEYMKLQKIKYEDRLEVSYNLTDEASIRIIPRLILQPLVENAIIHGLEPVSRVVHIQVSADIYHATNGDTLSISVKDDGVGCTSEDLQLNKSIALANIKRRLEIFADGSILTSRCKVGSGVEIYIIIPLDEKKER